MPEPSAATPVARPESSSRGSWLFYAVLIILGILVLTYAAYTEFQASRLQARYFSGVARDMRFSLEPGPSSSIRFPQTGPYDQRLGYSDLPAFLKRLQVKGYEIESQARVTPRLGNLIQAGYAPPYGEKSQAGLQILDCRAQPLFSFAYPERVYKDFDSVPPSIVKTLLFIENRELLDATYPTR